ncbi:zinc finger protein (MYND)-8 [Ciona intestinalis]
MSSCVVCNTLNKVMKRCTRCRNAFYCSRSCQIKHWPEHKNLCQVFSSDSCNNVEKSSNNDKLPLKTESLLTTCVETCGRTISVHCNHVKHKLFIPSTLQAKEIIELISKTVHILPSKIKLIAKGIVVTEQTVEDVLFVKKIKVIMAVGEVSENEDGLHTGDIEMIMEQLSVSRNVAVKGLRFSNGNLVDAILHIGNNL